MLWLVGYWIVFGAPVVGYCWECRLQAAHRLELFELNLLLVCCFDALYVQIERRCCSNIDSMFWQVASDRDATLDLG